MSTKTKTITLRNNTLTNDILFNSIEIKFPVQITRTKGKKNTQFPSKWNLINKNKCTGNEHNIANARLLRSINKYIVILKKTKYLEFFANSN